VQHGCIKELVKTLLSAPSWRTFIRQTHTSNIFHETSHHGFGNAIPAKSGPVAGSKATQTHCGYFHCQFP
jgi:hypothetical protein